MRNLVENKTDFTEEILNHCLDIARGECSITFDSIENAPSEKYAQILYGLHCMNEEIENSKREEALRIKNEYEAKILKDKNRELEQFAFKASHDLKEPIRTIFSFSQLLKNSIIEDVDAKSLSYIDYIQTSAKRMTDMISHLLNYARFGNKPIYEDIDTHILLQNVHFDLITQIQRTQGKLIVKSLPTLVGDKTLLRLLFQNLISNALKFTRDNVPPIIEVSSTTLADFTRFEIKDNGVGIKEQYIPELFNIFARGHHKDKTYEGTGIGLSHCKKIVEIHGGEIWCESEVGVGTTFFFTISHILAPSTE